MTNKENQKRLDNKKIKEQEKTGKDMSGKMYYCQCCKYRDGDFCISTNEERVKKSLCSTADNRLKRGCK